MTLARIIASSGLAIVPLALVKILVDRNGFLDGYEAAAWIVLAAHALVAMRSSSSPPGAAAASA